MTNYTVDTLEKETDIGEFTALCLDTEKCRFACAECPAYGSNYSCPPFSFKTEDYLRPFGRVKLIMRVFQFSDIKKEKAFKILEEERKSFLRRFRNAKNKGSPPPTRVPVICVPGAREKKGKRAGLPGKRGIHLKLSALILKKQRKYISVFL